MPKIYCDDLYAFAQICAELMKQNITFEAYDREDRDVQRFVIILQGY